MQYCDNPQCTSTTSYYMNDDIQCSKCPKSTLIPCIQCLCRQEEWNPRRLRAKACPECGERLTTDYLGKCMAAQLGGMGKEIAGKMAELN